MILSIITVFGLMLFAEALLDKWGFYSAMYDYAAKTKTRFIFDLLTCNFCVRFHIVWIITVIYGAVAGYEWHLFAVPFVVSGFLTLKKSMI